MKLEWGKNGGNRGCEKTCCPSWPGATFEKLRPPHGRFGHTFGVLSLLVGGGRKLPAKRVPESEGGSPILGHCPEEGPPAGAVLSPPMGRRWVCQTQLNFTPLSTCLRLTFVMVQQEKYMPRYQIHSNVQLHFKNCSSVVSSGRLNRAPQTGGLKQPTFIFSQFWKPEVQDQGEGKVSASRGLSASVSSRVLSSVRLPGVPSS